MRNWSRNPVWAHSWHTYLFTFEILFFVYYWI